MAHKNFKSSHAQKYCLLFFIVNKMAEEHIELTKKLSVLPTGVKHMIIGKLLRDPFTIMNTNCEDDQLKELICNNFELLKILWYRYIASELPKTEDDKEMGAEKLRIEYDKIIILYKNPLDVYRSNKNIYKKYDMLHLNAKNTYKLYKIFKNNSKTETSLIVKKLLDGMTFFDFIIDGKTLLILNCKNNNYSNVKILIEKGADVNLSADSSDTPLSIAYDVAEVDNINKKQINSGINLMKLLLDNGANTNSRRFDLLYAIIDSKYTEKYMDILLDYNFDYNKKTDGQIVLIEAINNRKSLSVIQILINKTDLNIQDYVGDTPLMSAVSNKNYVVMEILLGLKVDVNKKNIDNYTALVFAIYNNDLNAVKLLVEHGAEININNYKDAMEYYPNIHSYLQNALKNQYSITNN